MGTCADFRKINVIKIILLSLLISFIFPVQNKGFYHLTKYRVELYSHGVKIREWISERKVFSKKNSNQYIFSTIDGEYVEVSGTVIITELKNE